MKRFKVAINARPLPGQDPEQVRQRLGRLFRLPAGKEDQFFNGRSVVVKSNLDRQQAEIIRQTIEKTGAACTIVDQQLDRGAGSITTQTSVNFCPKCGFRITSPGAAEDPSHRPGECPSCGVVIAKFLEQRQTAQPPEQPVRQKGRAASPRPKEPEPHFIDQPPAEQGVPEQDQERLAAAPLRRRFLSSFYTTLCAASIFLPLYVVAFFLIYLSTRWRLGDVLAQEVFSIASSAGRQDRFIKGLLLIGIAGLSLIIVPFRQQQTWGQQHQALRIVDENGRPVDNEGVYWLRAVATTLVYFSVGLLALVPWFNKQRRSLADMLSKTHLAMASTQKPQLLTGMVIIASIILVLCGGATFVMKDSLYQTMASKIYPSSAGKTSQTMQSQADLISRERVREQMALTVLAQRCQDGDEDACAVLDQTSKGR